MESGAVLTGAVKISHVPLDPSVKVGGGRRSDGFDTVHFQVNHAAAFRTDEMVMRRSIGIKMICAISHIQPVDFTIFGQER